MERLLNDCEIDEQELEALKTMYGQLVSRCLAWDYQGNPVLCPEQAASSDMVCVFVGSNYPIRSLYLDVWGPSSGGAKSKVVDL